MTNVAAPLDQPQRSRLEWPDGPTIARLAGALSGLALAGALWTLETGLAVEGRLALTVFLTAVLFWTCTRVDATYVALAAALACAVLAGGDGRNTITSLGDDTIWLILGAFIVAGGIAASGLSARLANLVGRHARTTRGLFYGLTACVVLTAFIVPSTTGRAALFVPLFLAFRDRLDCPRTTRAMALLLPVTIVLSASGSLVGASANLIATSMLEQMTGIHVGFVDWLIIQLPLAAASSFAATWIIMRLFLDEQLAARRLADPVVGPEPSGGTPGALEPQARLSGREWHALGVVAAVVVLWVTEDVHNISTGMVAMLGALAVTLPGLGLMPIKQALKSVEWPLLIFLAASLEIARALTGAGTVEWLVDLTASGIDARWSLPIMAALALAAVSLLSHIVVPSRTARAAVLIPAAISLAWAQGLDPAAMTHLAAAGIGYCLTLSISSKSVLVFAELHGETFTQRDLLRLTVVLLPAQLMLLALFAIGIWPLMGLPLFQAAGG